MECCRWKKIGDAWGIVGPYYLMIPGKVVDVYRSGDPETQKPAHRTVGEIVERIGAKTLVAKVAPTGWKPEGEKKEERGLSGMGKPFGEGAFEEITKEEFPDWTKLFDGKAVAA